MTIRSMTGYASAKVGDGELTVVVELKSVNHRFLNISFRMPSYLVPAEEKLKRALKGKIQRGAVDVTVSPRGRLLGVEHLINADAARTYLAQWERLGKKCGVTMPLTPEALVTMPDIFVRKDKTVDARLLEKAVMEAFGKCADKLIAVRESEGRALKRTIEQNAARVGKLVRQIGRRAPLVLRGAQKRLRERITTLMNDVKTAAGIGVRELEREIALIADRGDVTEELTRLDSHLAHFTELVKDGHEVGKRLDFLMQEMLRESNTIGAKSSDSRISRTVIELKGEIEKIREQVQNIE